MRIAVAGASGFIGSNLVLILKEIGYDVINISRANGYDLNDWESVKYIKRCDALIHLAAKTNVPDSFDDPRGFYQTNITLTINALELARIWGAKVVYMSSFFYGKPIYIPIDENHPLKPHNPYAESKYLSEMICKAYSRDFKLNVLSLRLFNVYGPEQTGNFLIPEIVQKLKKGNKVITLKDPRPRRDYIYIDDVVSAIICAIHYNKEGFEVFNLGSGKSVSVDGLVSKIQEYSHVPFEVEYTNEFRFGEVLESVADIRSICSAFNWFPKFDLDQGLKELFKKNVV